MIDHGLSQADMWTSQCCVLNDPCSPAATDALIFNTPIDQFIRQADARNPPCFNWTSDGCSAPAPNQPAQFDFTPFCRRHDFAYRNTQAQRRCTEPQRQRIDDNFKNG